MCVLTSSSVLPSQVIARRPNVSKQLHMPAQSGSTSMLARMRRGYSRDAYDALVERIRAVVPGVSFSTDIIVGELTRATPRAIESRQAKPVEIDGVCLTWRSASGAAHCRRHLYPKPSPNSNLSLTLTLALALALTLTSSLNIT